MPQGRIVPPRGVLSTLEKIALNLDHTSHELNLALDKSIELLRKLTRLKHVETNLSLKLTSKSSAVQKLKKVKTLSKNYSLYSMGIEITSEDADYGDVFTCLSTEELIEGMYYNFSVYRYKKVGDTWVVWLSGLKPEP